MTKPPCYKDGRDCERRYIGCKALCEEWHKWLVIHEDEAEMIRRKKRDDHDVDGFLMGQGRRTRICSQVRRDEQKRRRR